MSTSDSKNGEDDPAEPVDAEFEPAPEGEDGPSAEPGADKPKSGAGWFKVALFVIAAAAIGGGSGWLAGQVLHAPVFGADDALSDDLQARLAALEAADEAVTQDALDALQARIEALEEAQDASGLRGDAVEQLVRDVADLRDRVAALEARPQTDPAADAGDEAAPGPDPQAIADLEARVTEAFEEVERRLQSVEELALTARDAAETARGAAQQAMDAAAAGGAGPADPETGGAQPAPAGEVAALRSALETLERRQGALADQLAGFDQLSDRLDALDAETASTESLAALARRLDGVERAVSDLEQAARAVSGAAEAERSLAAQALAFASLSEAASGSQPFAAEYAELARVWPDAPAREALLPVARTGAPTVDSLANRFPADAVRAATGEAETYFGVLRIRREGDAGPAAAIEAALAENDLDAALEIARTLQGDAAAAIAEWLFEAEQRARTDAAIDAMAFALAARQEAAE